MTVTVAVLLTFVWRSGAVRYELKAAALASGALLVTPYLFLYDEMVLAIAVAFLVRVGLDGGFERPSRSPPSSFTASGRVGEVRNIRRRHCKLR
jgi:hypothetical protein